MNNAHVESLQLLATPFREDTPQPFAFGPGSTWASATADIRERIPIMLHHRLTPPPRETYSLNRCVYRACFPRFVLTYFVELQKVERCVLVGIEVASYGGLQEIVG
jgi:hypothetical protein